MSRVAAGVAAAVAVVAVAAAAAAVLHREALQLTSIISVGCQSPAYCYRCLFGQLLVDSSKTFSDLNERFGGQQAKLLSTSISTELRARHQNAFNDDLKRFKPTSLNSPLLLGKHRQGDMMLMWQ